MYGSACIWDCVHYVHVCMYTYPHACMCLCGNGVLFLQFQLIFKLCIRDKVFVLSFA